MQPLVTNVRSSFTTAQVNELLIRTPGIQVSHGCELIQSDLTLIEDISDYVANDGSVARDSYATLHGSCSLSVTRDLDWGNSIIRPYMKLTGTTPTYGSLTIRFNLGAYYASSDDQAIEDNPRTYAVVGYDILSGLADLVGDSYAVSAGDNYLTVVESIIASRGYTQYSIDYSAASATLPTSRVWPIDSQTTWLTICNDLLSSIGYRGIWSDWDGRLRIEPYTSPSQRAPEWVYDMGDYSIVSPKYAQHRDLFNAPNRWVAVQSNRSTGDPPSEGDGVYSYTNTAIGSSSVQARGGRTLTKVFDVDAADQASLQATAQVTIDADMSAGTKLDIVTSPMPLHWHFDRLLFSDSALGVSVDAMTTAWTLPFNGDDMTHTWAVLS